MPLLPLQGQVDGMLYTEIMVVCFAYLMEHINTVHEKECKLIFINLYSVHPVVIIYKLYYNKPSVTTKFLSSVFNIYYSMFWPASPSSGNTKYKTLAINLPSVLYCVLPKDGQASQNML
jgi:hypothetical protein